jgi:hypothetical protein
MSENGLSIYRCSLSNGSEEWFLSKLEPGLHPSDERNVDYYSTFPFPKSTMNLVPHPADWNTLAKGRQPPPLIRKLLERDLLVLDVPMNENSNNPLAAALPQLNQQPAEASNMAFLGDEDFAMASNRASPASLEEDYSTYPNLHGT